MKSRGVVVLALAIALSGTAYAATETNQPKCSGSQCQVDITAPPTSKIRPKKPARQQVHHTYAILHWATATLAGYCNVAGERVVTDWNDPGKTVPSFVNGGGSQTLHTSILVDNAGQTVANSKIVKVCGSTTATSPPVPPRAQDIWNQVSGQFSVDGITISPTAKGLTGVPTQLSAAITNPGSIVLNDPNYQVKANITVESITWDMGEDGLVPAGATHSYSFQTKGVHRIQVNVVFRVVYQVSGLAIYQRTFLTPALSQTRSYQVAELRSIPAEPLS